MNLTAATGVDHVNPKSCLGDLVSGSVNIQALWVTAQNEANEVLIRYFGDQAAHDFNILFQNPKTTTDLLRPEGKYVGTSTSDSLSEYESQDADAPHHDTNPPDPTTVPTQDDENDGILAGMTARAANVDLEDFLPSSPSQAIQPPPSTLFINGPDGKEYYKGSVVASYLRGGHRAKKVVERTLRARGVTLESLREARDPNVTDILSGDDSVVVGDLAASLVCPGGQQVCLVVIHIIGFVHKKSRIDRVATEMLEQRNGDLVVTGEVLEILPLQCDDDANNSSWAWSLNYLTSSGKTKTSSGKTKTSTPKLTVKRSSFSFPAWLIIPLCPTLCDSCLVHDQPPQPFTWSFEEEVLNESLSRLWGLLEEQHPENIHDTLKTLTSLSIEELPYQSSDGEQSTFVYLPTPTPLPRS